MKRFLSALGLLVLSACAVSPGECTPEPCLPMCLRAVTCVTACGGPATNCGCCGCAEGSFDDIACD